MQQYDIATKVLMDQAAPQMLETFVGIRAVNIEFLEILPQESVSLKRSDYILRVYSPEGSASLVLWEFLSVWRRDAILNLIDYMARALLKYALPVIPVVLLLKASPRAADVFEESGLSLKFTLIRLYDMAAEQFLREADLHLLPFIPVMRHGEQCLWEAETHIYNSSLPTEEKADLLTAMTMFAGLKDKQLAKELVRRRRDLMIESYGYEIIKKEGYDEGLQQGLKRGVQQGIEQERKKAIVDVLQVRFNVVKLLKGIDELEVLEELLRKAVVSQTIQEFRTLLTAILKSADA